MHKCLKKLLLGLVIWAVPFLASFLFWDIEKGAPAVSLGLFNAIMAFVWAIGFAIVAYFYFKNVKKSEAVTEGFAAGFVWYIEALVLDLIFLVFLFKMSFSDFAPMFLTYSNALVISIAIGYIISKK